MTVLLADAGATKTDWVRLTGLPGSFDATGTFSGSGLSPVHMDSDVIVAELRKIKEALGVSFDNIRYYGSGVGSPVMAEKMEKALSCVFDCDDVVADSDMAGAAIAVLGDSPGIACIMGTGSNSCHFDGQAIDRKSASLGYILDDDGGGVAFGKALLSDIFKGIAPADVTTLFLDRYDLSVADVVDRIYRQPSPNSWIAGFLPFIVEHSSHPYISDLIDVRIKRFLEREFFSYPQRELVYEGVGFVGSPAVLFADRIRREFDSRGWTVRGFIAKPLSNLVKNIRI